MSLPVAVLLRGALVSAGTLGCAQRLPFLAFSIPPTNLGLTTSALILVPLSTHQVARAIAGVPSPSVALVLQ